MAKAARGIHKSVHSTELAQLREILVDTRKRAGLTQHQLAERLGKPQSFVAKYERGERRIDVIEFLKIVRAMGADPAAVFRTLIRRVG
jgi:transcriptional regulator with XRE-family HTH domain